MNGQGVCAPQGFRAAGVAAGLKDNGKRDVAIVINDGPEYTAAAVTTSNRVYAAPVQWIRDTDDGTYRAVVLNSGGANAATGEAGFRDTVTTAHAAAQHIGCSAADVAVCSTGVIGERLKMTALLDGVGSAVVQADSTGGVDAAQAIMTTDTHVKVAQMHGSDGAAYTLGGMVKGAGMLAPAMATMLCVITTDAQLEPHQAREAVHAAVNQSFNRIDSDGAMSTNDTVILLASGASGVSPDMESFTTDLTALAQDLARQLIGDAEGAAHDICIEITGAETDDAALAVARAISRSNLVKTAIFGNDPNWGRILAQVGTVPENIAAFQPADITIDINGVRVCSGGCRAEFAELDMSEREVCIHVDLHAGSASAQLWTNDLTYDYVRENAEYTS